MFPTYNPYDPYGRNFAPQQAAPMRSEITHVNGENGARAYQLAPNSSALLLDEHNPIVWLVKTDGAGYKTVDPYQIAPYQPAPPVDVNGLEERVKRLEEALNGKSHNAGAKRQKDDE